MTVHHHVNVDILQEWTLTIVFFDIIIIMIENLNLAHMMISDLADSPLLHIPFQRPSMSSKYHHRRQGFLKLIKGC